MSRQTREEDGEQSPSLGFYQLLTSRRTRPYPKSKEDTHCTCAPADGCGQSCINRATYHECDPAGCPAGLACTNQRLQQRSGGIACSLRHMPGKGWGVVTDQVVPHAGTLIVEYCGEVVSRAEGTKRAALYAAKGLQHTYIMSLSSDEVIDATVYGNMARFINHSCAPNCVSQVWHVHGEPRVGIFSLRHIASGEELTYSYNLALQGQGKPTRCLCGAECCRQVLGAPRLPAGPPSSDRSSGTHISSDSEEESSLSNAAVRAQRRAARRQALRGCLMARLFWPSSRARSRLRPLPVDDYLDDFASGPEADARRVGLHRVPRLVGVWRGALVQGGTHVAFKGPARRRQLQLLRLRLEEQEDALLATGLQVPRGTRVSQLQALDSEVEGHPRTRRTPRRTTTRPSLFCRGWAPLPPAKKVYPPSMVPAVAALQCFWQWRAQLVHPPPTLAVLQLSLGLV